MTDDGRSMSRRERRAQEARDAARPAEDTDALSLGPISESIPTHSADGRALTRRERRRLERARQPMETWTAEEEMIATGQIPAMTPERIAEQEQIAREKAEAAQQEAEAASAELEGLAGRPEVAQSAPYAPSAPAAAQAAPPMEVPVFEPELAPEGGASAPEAASPPAADTPPERASLIAAVAADKAPAAPDTQQSSWPQAEDGYEQAAHEQQGYEQQSYEQPAASAPSSQDSFHSAPSTPAPSATSPPAGSPPAVAAPSPLTSAPSAQAPASTQSAPAPAGTTFTPALSAASAPEPAPTHFSPAPESASSAPATAPVLGMPPGMTPEMFAELFPPGSLQRRLMEQQAASEAAEAEAPEDPAAEIRRLTQEAVAGIDAAGARAAWDAASPATAQSSPDHAPSQPSPWLAPGDIDPVADSAPFAGSAPASAFAPEPTVAPHTPSAPQQGFTAEQPARWGSSAPQSPGQPAHAASAQPAPAFGTYQDESSAAEQQPRLEQAPFDAIIGDRPETVALDQAATASAEFNRPVFGELADPSAPGTQQAPHHAAFESAPEAFAAGQSATPVSPAPAPWGEHPLAQVDRDAPELPQMAPAQRVQQPDLSGIRPPSQLGIPAHLANIDPVPTGQLEVPKRDRPALEEADAPRHFKWAHLAVFGAVALLLGVVVWNLI